jgi:hypothetical protein
VLKSIAVPKYRSPVLGFNHNIRHLGWLFHVQTEDSGITNPHIFTHLFHDGVIVASKKCEYDAESDMEVVKGLMQAQHKSVMRMLRRGTFDDKIRKYLGEAPPGGEVARTPSQARASRELAAAASGVAAAVGGTGAARQTAAPASAMEAASPIPVPGPGSANLSYEELEVEVGNMTVDPDAGTTLRDLPGAIPGPAAAEAAAAAAAAAEEEEEDEDVNDVFRKLAEPVLAPPVLPTAGHAGGDKGELAGTWLLSRPGRTERPFERRAPAPVVREDMAVLRERRHGLSAPEPAPTAGGAQKKKTNPGTVVPTVTVPPAGGPRRLAPPHDPLSRTQPMTSFGGPGTGLRPKPPAAGQRGGESVVVARPAVVIGSPPTVIGAPPEASGRAPAASPRDTMSPSGPPDNIFGQDLISEKSLDEVIMAYLSEDSNDE